MPIRQYDFVTGIQSSAAPTIATPTLGDDLTTKTYVDGLNTAMDLDKAERQYWGDAVADNAALKAVIPGERFDRQVRLSEGGTALYRYDSADVGVDDGDLVLQPNDAPVAGRWLKLTVTGGGGGGTGSAAGSNLLQALMSDEADSVIAVNPNVISDDFGDEDKGTKVNVIQSASALVFPSGQTTGSYLRTSASSVDLATFDSVMVASLRAGSPNATAWSPSVTSTSATIVFSGDLTGIFAASSIIAIYKQATIDGALKQIWLANSSNEIAQLTVTSATYSSGPNTTTMVVANPSALDLSMGLSAANYPDNLRIAPFDVVVKSRANTGEALTAATIEDASIFEPRTIKISGESIAADITAVGLNGSAVILHASRSPNGQYYVTKVLEQAAGSATFHWFYSIDKGKTWTKYSSTRSHGGTTQNDEYNGSFQYANPNATVIANNGKWFSIYNFYDGSRTSTKGVYGDISVGSPTFNDTPGIANDGNNFNTSNSSVAGFIFSRGGAEESAPIHVTGDLTDLSFVVAIGSNNTNNILMMQQFTAGGATAGVRNSTATSNSWFANPFVRALTSGSSPTHRYSIFMFTTGSVGVWRYWEEGTSGTAITTIDPMGAPNGSAGTITAAINPTTHKAYGLHVSGLMGYSSFTNSSVPAFVNRTLFYKQDSRYLGWSTNVNENYLRTSRDRCIIDPANDNHVFFAWEYLNQLSSDGSRTALLAEIYDNDFVGEAISHYTLNASYPLRSTSATTKIGQTFTPGSNTRIRTLIVGASNIGTVAFGNTITCEIFATAAGVPTGAALATAVNSYDARKRGVNQYQELFFNFNSLALTSGTQYAFVLSSTTAINASNYTQFVGDSTGAYAGGTQVTFNGSTWATTGTDLAFKVHGEYLYDMSADDTDLNSNSGWKLQDSLEAQEHQISLLSTSSTTIISTYRVTTSIDPSRWINEGYIRRKVVSISGSSATTSAISNMTTAGFNTGTFDENLVLNIAPGTDACTRRTFNTGALSGTQKSENRSGHLFPINSYESPVYTADTDFQEGVCSDHNGSGGRTWSYSNYQLTQYNGARFPWAIEAEIKGPYGALDRVVASGYTNVGDGFVFGLSGGFLRFWTGGTTITASDLAEPTAYHKIRFVWDGTAGKLYRTTSAPHTTFTEVGGYSVNTVNGTIGGAYTTIRIGAIPTPDAAHWQGRIGYVKIAKGFNPASGPFAYDGWRDQGSRAHHLNLGDLISAKRMIGQEATALATQYARFSTLDQNASANSLKDVYASTFVLTRSMTAGKVPELKIEWDRVGNQDSSRIEGIIGEYSK